MKHNNTRSKKGEKHNKTFKMNCHPNNKNRLHKNTCYTPHALLIIRDAYNNSHEHTITSENPKTIYKQLRKRLTHCEQEDCWMDVIQDPSVRLELDHLLFAPDSPKSWNQDPYEWLSNWDIRDVLRQYEMSHRDFKLMGPSSIDYDTKLNDGKCVWEDICRLSLKDLLHRGKRKLGIVFNLDKHNEPGSHWVSLFVDCDQKFIFYYDSSMKNTPSEIDRLIHEIKTQGENLEKPIPFEIIKNNLSHQSTNTECGMYCLFFIITMLTEKLHKKAHVEMYGGGGKRNKKLSKEEKIKLFTTHGLNDSLMKSFRTIYFNSA